MNIPEGYVLVPINATSAMIEYGKDERMQCLANPSLSVQGALVRIYSAMIGAAPFVCESNVEEYDEAKERELFEAEYAKKIQYDLGFDDAKEQIKSLRDGENYKSRMAYLNGYWSGWKDCAKSRAWSAE